MAPKQQADSKQELSTKDAMFLLELMRDSPQPILFHIGPYCQKTGSKPNTIVKRLGEIKKRNGLNIVTTTNPPNGSNSYTIPKAASSGKRGGSGDNEAKPTVKRERAPMAGGANASELPTAKGAKVETSLSPGLGLVYGLPSPADSTASTPLVIATTGSAGSAVTGASTGVSAGASMAHIPLYMPQKRSLDDHEEHGVASEVMNKKTKMET